MKQYMQYMVYTHPHLPCENFKCTSPLLPFYFSSGDVRQLLFSYDCDTQRNIRVCSKNEHTR